MKYFVGEKFILKKQCCLLILPFKAQLKLSASSLTLQVFYPDINNVKKTPIALLKIDLDLHCEKRMDFKMQPRFAIKLRLKAALETNQEA